MDITLRQSKRNAYFAISNLPTFFRNLMNQNNQPPSQPGKVLRRYTAQAVCVSTDLIRKLVADGKFRRNLENEKAMNHINHCELCRNRYREAYHLTPRKKG